MKSINWKDTIIQEDKKIQDVIKSLINSQLQICLIIDAKKKFIGTVTDGDIRRALLKGFNLNSPLKKIINRKCLVVRKNLKKKQIRELMLQNSINQIPIIDKSKKVIDLVTFRNISETPKIKNTIFVFQVTLTSSSIGLKTKLISTNGESRPTTPLHKSKSLATRPRPACLPSSLLV